MTKKRKDYTQEFRDSAVKLITEQGYKTSEAVVALHGRLSECRESFY